MADHINEFNVITTQLSYIEISFEDEIKTLILLSSLPERWFATIAVVNGLLGSAKLKLDDIQDLILSEDVRKRESGEYLGSALSTQGRGRSQRRGQNQNLESSL